MSQDKNPNLDRVFDDFDKADPTAAGGRNPKITVAGAFLCEVKEVRYKDSDQFEAMYLIVEFEVLESNDETIKVGKLYSWTHDMLNKWYGKENTKQFIAAAAGVDPASDEALAIDRDTVQDAWGEDQPLAGHKVRLSTSPKTTKSGRDYCVHTWSPAAEDD